MKKLLIITGLIFSFLITISVVYACTPCPSILTFEETVEKSNLIIIGQKTEDGPRSDFGEVFGGPDWIEVKIIEFLKGSSQDTIIKVNSWDAMCGYGIVINDERNYVMLLQKRDSMYDAVDFGCSVKTFPVDNNLVDFNGDKISIEEFTNKLGSQETRQIIDDEPQKRFSLLYYIVPAIIILVVLFYIFFKKKK